MQTMVICVAVSTGGGGVRYIAVSLPLIACLLDGKKYMLPVDPKPPQDQPEPPQDAPRHRGPLKRGFEFKTRQAPRAPTLRSLVKLALKCESAEQMGQQLKKRFEARQRRLDPGRKDRAEARSERELERLLRD